MCLKGVYKIFKIQKMKSILSVLVLSVILLQTALALPEFEAYRLAAFEQNGQLQGSKIGSFNLVGTHFSADLLRKLAVIHYADVSNENINAILEKKPSGLLVILPKERFESKEGEFWRAISENLGTFDFKRIRNNPPSHQGCPNPRSFLRRK